jgi:hypothetical protein
MEVLRRKLAGILLILLSLVGISESLAPGSVNHYYREIITNISKR